jgi:hypothetical protein
LVAARSVWLWMERHGPNVTRRRRSPGNSRFNLNPRPLVFILKFKLLDSGPVVQKSNEWMDGFEAFFLGKPGASLVRLIKHGYDHPLV